MKEEAMKILKGFQKKRLNLWKCYLDNSLISFSEFEKARERILNPPEWFVKKIEVQAEQCHGGMIDE